MKKQQLMTFISKYYLGGEIESVVWSTKNKITSVNFTHPDRTLIGNTTLNDSNISDSQLGIFETSKLIQMVSVLDSDINISINEVAGTTINLNIKDDKYNMKFVLADSSVIPKPATMKQLPEFEIEIAVTPEFVANFQNALKAVTSEICAFIPKGDTIDVVLGYSTTINQNNITFNQAANCKSDEVKMFSSTHLKNILASNKGIDGTILISSNGLMKVNFNSSEFNSEYLLVESQTN